MIDHGRGGVKQSGSDTVPVSPGLDRSLISIDTGGIPLLTSPDWSNIRRRESIMATSPKISAKIAKDALRIAIAKALVWTKMRTTKPVFSPAATGRDR